MSRANRRAIIVAKTIADAIGSRKPPPWDPPYGRVQTILGRKLTLKERGAFFDAWRIAFERWHDEHFPP